MAASDPTLPVAVFEIKEYMVIWRQMEVRDFGSAQARIRGIVRCTGTNPENGIHYRLDVYFLAPDSDVPAPIVNLDENAGALFFPISDLAGFVDILRNEKPIYGHLRGDRPEWTSITTTQEPVGAGDED